MPNTSVRAAAEDLSNFNRRQMLRGLAASSAAAVTLVAATIPAAPAEHPDAELFRLDKDMEAVDVHLKKIEGASNRISKKVDKAVGPGPLHPADWKSPSMPDDLEEMRRASLENVSFAAVAKGDWRRPEPVDSWYRAVEEGKARIKATWDEHREKRAEQYRLLGYDAKQAEFEARCKDIWAIGMSIFSKPAQTLEGMTVKLRAGERLGLEDFADPNEAFLSIAADIRRLAAGGASS